MSRRTLWWQVPWSTHVDSFHHIQDRSRTQYSGGELGSQTLTSNLRKWHGALAWTRHYLDFVPAYTSAFIKIPDAELLTCNILLEKSFSSAMLPMLCRRCVKVAAWSSLLSVVLLVSDLLDFCRMNSALAALRLYSSSTAFLLLCFMKKITPPTMAAMARTPTTTPTAMPTLLEPPPPLD